MQHGPTRCYSCDEFLVDEDNNTLQKYALASWWNGHKWCAMRLCQECLRKEMYRELRKRIVEGGGSIHYFEPE